MERPDGYVAVKNERMSGKVSARGAAKRLNDAPKTFLKWAREDYAY